MLKSQDRGRIAKDTLELNCLEETGLETRETLELKISEANLPRNNGVMSLDFLTEAVLPESEISAAVLFRLHCQRKKCLSDCGFVLFQDYK